MVRIFVSYSRSDGGDFADHISDHYEKEANDVFIDHKDILGGEEWSEKIKKSISNSDIVIVILTRSALKSQEVEKEILESIRQGKRVIPAKYQNIAWSDLKWGLEKKQGFQFDNKNSLIRHLDEIIFSNKKNNTGYTDLDESVINQPTIKYRKKRRLYFIILGTITTTIILSLIFSNQYLWNTIPDNENTSSGSPRSQTIKTDQSPISTKPNEEKEKYVLLNTFGSIGKNQGKFNNPSGIAIDYNDNVYVADSQNNRIQEFDDFENFKIQWPIYDNKNYSDGSKQFNDIRTKNSTNNNVPVLGPFTVAVDSKDNVYVTDSQNNRIQKFTNNGTYLADLIPKNDTKKYSLKEIAIDYYDDVYVSDIKNDVVMKFDSNGTFITKWGSSGNRHGEFNNPLGIAVDYNDNVYVADSQNNRIQKFTNNGTYLTDLLFQGKAKGQKLIPSFVTVDPDDDIYIADKKYDIIQKFTSNGTFVTEWKSDNIAGITADSKSTVYSTDYVNDHIHVFIPKVGVSTQDYNS